MQEDFLVMLKVAREDEKRGDNVLAKVKTVLGKMAKKDIQALCRVAGVASNVAVNGIARALYDRAAAAVEEVVSAKEEWLSRNEIVSYISLCRCGSMLMRYMRVFC